MNTNTVNPGARLRTDLPFGTGSRRTALRRPVQESVVAGVAAGLARYLGVDVMIVPSISPPTWVPQMCRTWCLDVWSELRECMPV